MNDKDLRNAKPRDKAFQIWDDQIAGLHVIVSPHGTKSFYLRYRFGGRRLRKKIGLYMNATSKEPATKLATARAAARTRINQIADGIDPFAEEKRKVAQEEVAARAKATRKTFAQLASDYIELHAKPHKKSWKRDQDILNRDVLSRIGDRPLEEIKKADIADVTRPILKRGSPSSANHCYEVMRAILNWGANDGYGGMEYSPMIGMKAPAPKGDGWERVLSEEEIRTAWSWFETGDYLSELTRYIFKLTLATGQRPGEVCQMQKEHVTVYGNRHIWTIPGAIRKSRQTHVVPLSDIALEILEQVEGVKADLDYVNVKPYNHRRGECFHCGNTLPSRQSRHPQSVLKYCSEKCRGDRALLVRKTKRKPRFINSPFVFPSPQQRGKPMSEDTLNTVLDRARRSETMTLDHWTPRDLRRSCGTHITGLVKETREIMDKVLGHKDGKVGAIYDRYAYFDEKCRALDGWSRELGRILNGTVEEAKVIPLYGRN